MLFLRICIHDIIICSLKKQCIILVDAHFFNGFFTQNFNLRFNCEFKNTFIWFEVHTCRLPDLTLSSRQQSINISLGTLLLLWRKKSYEAEQSYSSKCKHENNAKFFYLSISCVGTDNRQLNNTLYFQRVCTIIKFTTHLEKFQIAKT